MNNTVFLRVNGRDWGGWTSVRISAGIDRIARDFNVSITRQWPGGEDVPPVKNGDSVEVLIGDDLVITGWVEALPLRYDAQTIMTGIVGRSKTADLIDCSASPAQHNGENLFLIASALARPFGVDVVDAGAPAAAVIEAQPEHGETVVDCLNRLLGQAQALAYDDERGRLVLGRPGSMKAATALVLGENILSCDTERSVRERFSSYLVTGQRPGTDDDFGEATIAAIRQSTGDAGVTRYRPHTIQQSGTATTDSCKSRCEFEARQRAAKTLETTYTVQGWRQGNGELWKPNQAVVVYDPLNGFDNETLVIAEVTYSQGNNGTLTEIRVGPADAYLPEPFRPKAKKKVSEEADF
ncbi:baseplate protein [Salmonella enterica subsp. enterica serovar Typhimurium]|uniref:Baseplate protein n=2 Tax=Salmonella enterica TaxID=28901 RepID=A0A702D0Z7_SALER|nr:MULTISPECIES: baseplate protein [Salmonella]EBH2523698.1 baseplate protein [Salmonella enterica subsp. enterica serovar Enteritidis]EGX4206869.1 baseplate protein [Salmonella enterica subsp. enterica serovar Buckeye]HAR9811466.1 baseplate protein [Salmonella enterica subsp. enterica serovar 4,[5],12:i:-]EAA1519227.1 baseplate protein [Salmonella enterica subsp. enterica serovar Typhimurium]EAA4841903.1 baseplate protein [Salmonella enterica subsp. enterica serovar Typhimurium]